RRTSSVAHCRYARASRTAVFLVVAVGVLFTLQANADRVTHFARRSAVFVGDAVFFAGRLVAALPLGTVVVTDTFHAAPQSLRANLIGAAIPCALAGSVSLTTGLRAVFVASAVFVFDAFYADELFRVAYTLPRGAAFGDATVCVCVVAVAVAITVAA